MPTLPINWILKNHISGAAPGFSAEYQAVYGEFTTKPSADVADAQNTMVSTLVSDGNWTLIDGMWIFAGHTNGAGESLIQWKNPTGNKAVLVNAPAFVAFEGFTGDALTSYENLQWNPTDDGSNYTQDAAAFILAIHTKGSVSTARVFGATTGPIRAISQAHSVTILNSGLDSTGSSVNVAAVTKFYVAAIRDGANSVYNIVNKTTSTFEAVASSGLLSLDYFAGAKNGNSIPSDFSDGQVAAIVVGDFTDAQHQQIIDAIDTYMVSNGKGILP